MKLTNAEIQKSIAELPDNIKQAVVTFDWAKEILDIAHEHNMQIDDADDFRHQTLLVILGKIPAEDYEKNLVSELGLSKDLASTMVNKANSRIFLELQKRAFGRNESNSQEHNNESMITSDNVAISDPYQEPLEHHEVRNILSSEGVHLVDEHTPESINTDLHREVSAMLSGEGVQPHIDLEPTFADTSVVARDNETTLENNENQITSQARNNITNNYNEPIDETDLTGIRGHRIDTSIVKTQYHNKPTDIFENTSPKSARDLEQADYTLPSLDKHIMENPFSAKTDTVEASPTEIEQIKESGGFLTHLKTED